MSQPGRSSRKRQSLAKTLAVATFAGVALGVVEVWQFGLFVPNLLRACAAGIAFTWVLALWGHFFGHRQRYVFFILCAAAGAVGGLAWWAIAPTQIRPLIPCVIGAVAAAVLYLTQGRFRRESARPAV